MVLQAQVYCLRHVYTRSFFNQAAIWCCALLVSVDLPAGSGVRRVNVPAIPHWDRLTVCIELLVRNHKVVIRFQQLPKTCVIFDVCFCLSYY